MKLDEKFNTLKLDHSYCSGVKVCGGKHCIYTKQRVNRCAEHTTMALKLLGPCNCRLVYVYPPDDKNDGRITLNAEGKLHNHTASAEWKIPPKCVERYLKQSMGFKEA